ncbi:hypothetical protein C8R43DRAFT_1141877 [Mycena crocata]|nr:hypothetical protein C8R43DRAFT_1141877 [Mycena crocata]
MPPPSSTPSLVAGGGDDLDDDDRLSFALTAAASLSSSATSSSKSALSRGSLGLDPDIAVSGGADGLGALSASSAHLGALRQLACCNAPTMRSPIAMAHFGSDGARAFMGSPRPLFPTVELGPPRFSRLLFTPGHSDTPPRNSTSPRRRGAQRHASDQTASEGLSYLFIFSSYPTTLDSIPTIQGIPALTQLRHSKIFQGAAFDTRGNYPRRAHRTIPWLKSPVLPAQVFTYLIQLLQIGYSLGLENPLQTPFRWISTTTVFDRRVRFFASKLRAPSIIKEPYDFEPLTDTIFKSVAEYSAPERLSAPATLRPELSLICASAFVDSPLFKILLSYIGFWYLGSDSPAIYSKAGNFVHRKTVTMFRINNGPLIGLPSRSCTKAGTIFNYTRDSDSFDSPFQRLSLNLWCAMFKPLNESHQVSIRFELDTDSGTPIHRYYCQARDCHYLRSTLVETIAGQYIFELLFSPSIVPSLADLSIVQVQYLEPFNVPQFSLYIDLKGFNMKAEPLVSSVGRYGGQIALLLMGV